MALVYSVAVHNKNVRRAVADGRHFDNVSDTWAFTNYLTIEANSREQALARVHKRLPAANGYVVDSIELDHDYGWGKLDR